VVCVKSQNDLAIVASPIRGGKESRGQGRLGRLFLLVVIGLSPEPLGSFRVRNIFHLGPYSFQLGHFTAVSLAVDNGKQIRLGVAVLSHTHSSTGEVG
jgi:hypothetical protein